MHCDLGAHVRSRTRCGSGVRQSFQLQASSPTHLIITTRHLFLIVSGLDQFTVIMAVVPVGVLPAFLRTSLLGAIPSHSAKFRQRYPQHKEHCLSNTNAPKASTEVRSGKVSYAKKKNIRPNQIRNPKNQLD